MNTMTQALYQSVVDETLGVAKSLFIERGIGEDVLRELRCLWEENVSKAGAIGEYVGAVKNEGGQVVAKQTNAADADAIKVEDTNESGKRPLEAEDGEAGEDGTNEPSEKKKKRKEDDDGDELGSDLDDSEIGELDDVQGADATGKVDDDSSRNTVLGAFLKVTRQKNRWKVALNGCVGLLNGREYLFKKLALELDWS